MFKTICSAQLQRRTNMHRIITGQDTVYRQCMLTTLISYKHGTSGGGGGWFSYMYLNSAWNHEHTDRALLLYIQTPCHVTVRFMWSRLSHTQSVYVTVATWIDALWFGIPEDIEIRTVNEAKTYSHQLYSNTMYRFTPWASTNNFCKNLPSGP